MSAAGYAAMDTAAKAVMSVVDLSATQFITQAPTNHGTDFRILSGRVLYQVQITPRTDYHRATVVYPRADVTVLIHCNAANLATEELFAENTMGYVADLFLTATQWKLVVGIFDLDPEEEPEMSYEGREGNVISYSATATVLADGA